MATAAFPWGGILYTGLLSTDLALLIEVWRPPQLPPSTLPECLLYDGLCILEMLVLALDF